MGRQIKPFIILCLALAGIVFILVNAYTRPPEEQYYSRLENKVQAYPGKPRSMYDQYQIGMYHLQQGDLDRAQKEFEKVISQYPYMEFQYGWISDDARKRIKEINLERERHKRIQDRNWPVPVETATIP